MSPEATLPFHFYQPRKGHPDWASLLAEARHLAAELGPSLTPPSRRARDVRRRARALATAADNYRVNRRRHRRGREDLRPLYFIWTVSRACNFLCTYCDDHRGRRYPELPIAGELGTAEGVRLLEVMRTRTPSVYFAGGEPTLRKDLPQLTRAAFELDYYPIFINTNGSAIDRLLGKPSWAGWLADTDVVIVSLDGLDESAMREMWGYRKPRDVMRNLLLLRELAGAMRIKLMVNTVIQPGRVGLARDVLDLACDLGIWFCPVPMNSGPSIAGQLLGDPDYEALVELILARKRAGHRITGSLRMNERLLRAHPLRCRNTLKPHLDHDGKLAWPCKASVNVAPAALEVLGYDHLDQLWADATQRIDPTGFPGPAPDQCGATCNWAQNYSTDAYVYGLEHPWSIVRDVGQLLGGRRVAR